MSKRWIGAALLVGALAGSAAVVARADGQAQGVNQGQFVPLAGQWQGCVDTWDGVIHLVDPQDPKHCVTIDFSKAAVNVTALSEKKLKGWPVFNVPHGESIKPKKEQNFVQVGDRLEVLDTRSGEVFALEGGLPKMKATEWKPKDLAFTIFSASTGLKATLPPPEEKKK